MNLKLLFIDDDDIQNDIMNEYVTMSEIPNDVNFFNRSIEALSYIEQSDSINLPNVLFIDVSMPLLNGWELLNKLEPIIESRQWLPSIYIATSSVSNRDKNKAKEQKYLKGFLNKPIKLAKVVSILEDEYNLLVTSN